MDLKYRDSQRSPGNSDDESNCHFLSDEELEFENGNERIQNDLLNEICSDIGIKDSMDLDFYDMASDSVIQFDQQLSTGIVAGTSETPSSLQDLFNMQNWTPVIGRNGSGVQNNTPAGRGPVPIMQPSQFSQRQQLMSEGQGHNVHQGRNVHQSHNVQHGQSQTVQPTTFLASQGHGSFQSSSKNLSQIQMSQVSSSQSHPVTMVTSQFSQDKSVQYQGQGQKVMQNLRGQGHRGYLTPQVNGNNLHSQGQLGRGLNTPNSNPGNPNCDKPMIMPRSNKPQSIVPSDIDDAPGAGFFMESQAQIKKEPKSFDVQTSQSMKTDVVCSKANEAHESSNQHSTLSTPNIRSPISLSTSPFSLSSNDKVVTGVFNQGSQTSQFNMSLYCDNILEKVGASPNETLAATNNLCSQLDKSGTSSQNSSSFVNSMTNQRTVQNTIGQNVRNNLTNESRSPIGSHRGTFTPLSCDNSILSSPAQSKPSSPRNDADLNSDFPGYETNPNSAMPSRMPSPSGYDPSPFVSRWTSPTTAASSPTKDLDDSGSHDLDVKQEPLEGQMHCGSPSISSTFPESPLPGFQGNTSLHGYHSNQRQTVDFQGDSRNSSSSGDALQKKLAFNPDQNLNSPQTQNSVRFSGTSQFDSEDSKPLPHQLSKVANSDYPSSPKHEPNSPCPSYPSRPTVPTSQSQRGVVCDTTTGSPKPNLQNPIDIQNRSCSVFKVPSVPIMEMPQEKSRPGSAMSSVSDVSMGGMSRANSLSGRPSVPGSGRQVIDLTCDTESADPGQWELKSPHDAGYHSGDLASNASRSTVPTPVQSIHGSVDNLSTKSVPPATSFSQLLQNKLNKVDGYNRYPGSSTVTTSSGGQVFMAGTPTIVPKFRDTLPIPNVQQDKNAMSNYRNYPNMKNWNKDVSAPPSVNNHNELNTKEQPNVAGPDNYLTRNSRKTAAHFASENSSVETSPTRHMRRKQMCVNPTYGEYSRDRSPISNVRTPLAFNNEGDRSQVVPSMAQNSLTGNQNGTSRSQSYTNLASPGSKLQGIMPLAKFVQRQLPPTDNAGKSKSLVVSSSQSSQGQSPSQNHNQRMYNPSNNNVPMTPQNHQNGQFPPCAQSPSSFNMSNISGNHDKSFNIPPIIQKNHAQPGNMQMMCSTPLNNGSIRMMQMNNKWQQGGGYHQRQAPYPQALGVRQSVHQTQPQNFEFGQNPMQSSQSCCFASWDGPNPGQGGQNIMTPNNTPNFHSNNQTRRHLLQSGGNVQQCNGPMMNAQNAGYLNSQNAGQNGAHFNPEQEYFNDSGPPTNLAFGTPGPPTNLDFGTPGPPTNFGMANDVPMMSPGHVLGPSQAQHWLVQKYKQRAINSQMDNSACAMSGHSPNPSGQSPRPFTQIKPCDHYSSQSELQQFQGSNSRNLKPNGQNKLPPPCAPNVCIDKNSNFIPINHCQNGIMGQPSNKFNNFHQPQIPGFPMKKEHVSFDDNPIYNNESFGSMVTNVSNTTPHPAHQFNESLLMNGTQDTCHSHDSLTAHSSNPFHNNLGHSSSDMNINATFSPSDPNNISDDQLTSIVIGSQDHSRTPWQPENTQTIPGQTSVPQKTLSGAAHDARQRFIRNLVCHKSKAFRSHPLFPLLRDLIVADMNFNTPTFPFRLIANLPRDFNKLLHNYLERNRTNSSHNRNAAVESVITDALKYAQQSLIEKITAKKKELGEDVEEQKATGFVEEFGAMLNHGVHNTSLQTPDGQSTSQYQGQGYLGPLGDFDMNSDTGSIRGDNQAKKHPVLPKEAVTSMMAWLREHRNNPYPNEAEKEQLLQETKISTSQLNYWFTNARRRILPKWVAQEANQFQHEVSSTS